jgi:NAD(P)-dependent dehydrogenase (short-subunit alcohol dehydrogenase family)
MRRLEGQVALITGATSGVGRAIALALAREGVHLVLVGRRADALSALSKETAERGASVVRAHQADLTDDGQVRDLTRQLESEFDRLDLLIHGAGIIEVGPVATSPVEQFDRQYRTNVRAPYLLTQLLLSRLRQQRGQIVFLNSTAGLKVPAESSQYAATKHALKAFADSLRDEVNPDGVRVLSLFLGRTATPMQEALHKVAGKPYRPEQLIQPEHIGEMLLDLLRLPTSAEVMDVVVRPMVKSTT